MTGIFPVFGVCALIPGSTLGGQITPLVSPSLLLNDWPEELSAASEQAFGLALCACASAADRIAAVANTTVKKIFAIIFTHG